MRLREGRALQRGAYGDSRVIDLRSIEDGGEASADQVLVGLNKTRRVVNARIRRRLGRDPDYPEVGDKLVCLKNNREKGLLNGGLWTIDEIEEFDDDGVRLRVASLDGASKGGPQRVYVRREFFEGTEDTLTPGDLRETDQFTYGYALTCHKAQGSQWDDVLIFDESYAFKQNRSRWLYTALTRAAETVTVAA